MEEILTAKVDGIVIAIPQGKEAFLIEKIPLSMDEIAIPLKVKLEGTL